MTASLFRLTTAGGARSTAGGRRRPNGAAVLALVTLPLLAATGCAAEKAPAGVTESEAGTPAGAPTAAAPETEKQASPSEASRQDSEPKTGGIEENPGFDRAGLNERLRSAAWSDDVAAAEKLIAWGADANARDETMQSAHLISTSEGHLELLRLTLAHGADVRDLDSWDGTGLIRAAERGHWQVVGELIQAGVPLDHVNRVGYQAIHEAVVFGRDDESYHATVRVLIAGGVDFSTPSVSEGQTPLQMAYARGFPRQAALIEALTTAPAPQNPEAALFAAAESGDPNAVAIALRAGAAPDARNADGRTALEIAEANTHPASAQILRALGG